MNAPKCLQRTCCLETESVRTETEGRNCAARSEMKQDDFFKRVLPYGRNGEQEKWRENVYQVDKRQYSTLTFCTNFYNCAER